MLAVVLHSGSPGFVATRLSRLLRDYHFDLSDAHRLASDFIDGQKLSIVFEQPEAAKRFVDDVRKLNVDAFVSLAIAAKAG